MSDSYKFVILDGVVQQVYEFDDGVWKLETPDSDESFLVDGDAVLKIEQDDDGETEVDRYVDPDRNGVYVKAESSSYLGDDDFYSGSSGDDNCRGGSGDDSFHGRDGDDDLYGESGNDYLRGDRGNDDIDGGDGSDDIDGGSGNDRLLGARGSDLVRGGGGHDAMSGGAGSDDLYGDDGDDSLSGGDDNDDLFGGSGRDVLRGENGRDNLQAGSGNDQLIGGGSVDICAGGLGADRFTYNTRSDSGVGSGNRDRITDFRGREGDILDLGGVDADSVRSGNQAFRFIGSDSFRGLAGQLRFAQGLLQADLNGDRRPDFEIEVPGLTSFDPTRIIL